MSLQPSCNQFVSLGNLLGGVSFGELLIILVVILLLFGAKRLPELARSLGNSLGEFKKGRDEGARAEKPIVEKVDSDGANKPSP